jgi:hypothetical protein
MDDERARSPRRSHRDALVTIQEGDRMVELGLAEYRLALIWLIDFNQDWAAMETATLFVVDGAAKRRVLQERLQPVADLLPELLSRGVDALELLAARYWFRQEETG